MSSPLLLYLFFVPPVLFVTGAALCFILDEYKHPPMSNTEQQNNIKLHGVVSAPLAFRHSESSSHVVSVSSAPAHNKSEVATI
jgi:hypothetical protein